MKLPIIVISYGIFAKTKKLLSYERHGEHLIPVFTDLSHADIFVTGMREEMQKLGDVRELTCQICTEKRHAISLFTTIGLISHSPPSIIINPARPNLNVGPSASAAIASIEIKKSLGEILEDLHSLPLEESTPESNE